MLHMSIKANEPIGLKSSIRTLFCVGWIADCDLQHVSDRLMQLAITTQSHTLLVKWPDRSTLAHWNWFSEGLVWWPHHLDFNPDPAPKWRYAYFPSCIWRLALHNIFFKARIKRLSSRSALAAKRSLVQIGFINLLVYGSPDGTLFIHRHRLKKRSALVD